MANRHLSGFEHFIATRQGNVLRSRSVVRVVEASRWNLDAALGVTGTPTAHQPPGMVDPFATIEESAQPHLDLDADLLLQVNEDLHWARSWRRTSGPTATPMIALSVRI